MKFSLLIVAAAGALAAAIIGPVYGGHPALVTGALVAGISAIGLGLSHWVAVSRSGWTLRSHVGVVIAIAVGVILATVIAGAELMFVSNHDALMISAIVVAAALVALRAAQVASAGVVREVGSIRDELRAVGAGEREPRVHDDRAARAGGAPARRRRLGPPQPRRGDLARPAHADDGAGADGRGDRG
jgi:hypothetical protein